MDLAAIVDILKSISFDKRYVQICNQFKDFDKGKTLKKIEVEEVLNKLDWDLKYYSKERIFLCDFLFKGFVLRFILPYKYGFIDCQYIFWDEKNNVRFKGGFSDWAIKVDADFESKVSYKFPIVTSEDDLLKTLISLLELHSNFITELKKIY